MNPLYYHRWPRNYHFGVEASVKSHLARNAFPNLLNKKDITQYPTSWAWEGPPSAIGDESLGSWIRRVNATEEAHQSVGKQMRSKKVFARPSPPGKACYLPCRSGRVLKISHFLFPPNTRHIADHVGCPDRCSSKWLPCPGRDVRDLQGPGLTAEAASRCSSRLIM